jgi:large subunit ribosomal protein L21
MFAVVKIAGFQEKVSQGMKLKVPSLHAEPGKTVTFPEVLLVSKGEGEVTLGKPTVAGASVEAKVLAHGRAEKIRVFKMRRRKRYRRTKGHRQGYTEIEVTKING